MEDMDGEKLEKQTDEQKKGRGRRTIQIQQFVNIISVLPLTVEPRFTVTLLVQSPHH